MDDINTILILVPPHTFEFKFAASVHVAFGHGTESSTSIKTYGKPREGNGGKSDGPALKDSAQANEQITIWSPPTISADGTRGSSAVGVDTSSQKIKKDYKEPWVIRLWNTSRSFNSFIESIL